MTESTTTETATIRESSLRSRFAKLATMRSELNEKRIEVSHRKSTEVEAYARQKSGHSIPSREYHAYIVLFDKTRAGKKTSSEYASLTKRIDALTAAMSSIEKHLEAKAEIAASKQAEKTRLAEFNESIKSRRVYSFTQRRRSCWGNVQTFHSINSHGIKKLPDGRFVVDRHTLSYDTVYIYRLAEAKSRVESRGDVFTSGPGAEISRDDIIKIMTKPQVLTPINGSALDWKQRYEKQFNAREAYEKYSKILERKTDPRNKYARWLLSLGACNNGICTAMASDPRTPYDTIRAGNSAEIAYLRNHATLKTTGAIPKLFELTEELCMFPSWETFE